jgi:hypothetical protein
MTSTFCFGSLGVELQICMLVDPAPADHCLFTGSIAAEVCESCAFSSGRISFSDLKGVVTALSFWDSCLVSPSTGR